MFSYFLSVDECLCYCHRHPELETAEMLGDRGKGTGLKVCTQ